MTVESLMDAMRRFDDGDYDPVALRAHAEKFDAQVFKREISAYVDQAWEEFQRKSVAST
jgi:hypothetical protein